MDGRRTAMGTVVRVGIGLAVVACGGTAVTGMLDGGSTPDLAMAATPADLSVARPGDGAAPQPDLSQAGGDMATPPPAGSLFSQPMPWTTDISKAAVDADSSKIIGGGLTQWGCCGGKFQIDFSITVQTADANTPRKTFMPTGDFYTPDCDNTQIPVPAGGAVEGEAGYQCTQDGDCHLLVIDPTTHKLFEMWRAYVAPYNGGQFNGGCMAVWDLDKAYPANLRGDGCTSADAGGFPMTAMLPTSDEVWAAVQKGGNSDIGHALRFILPNNKIRQHTYVHPGTHTTGSTSGGATTPPYGARFRLRADYPLASLPNDAARVIARTLQKYGMFLADGGNVPTTFADDRFHTHKWADMNFDAHSLYGLAVTDFQMIDGGTRYMNMDCARNP